MSQQSTTALLVMDMQLGILGRLPNASEFVSRVGKAITAAREHNIPVIYIVVGFRNGLPEISSSNKMFSQSKERFSSIDMQEFGKIHPDLTPQEGEIVCVKRRVSAFTGSDLEIVLRAKTVQNLVLTGISTSGVVLSTVREASDKDYGLIVLEDGCLDMDEEVHKVLTTKVFPKQADVMSIEEWHKKLTN